MPSPASPSPDAELLASLVHMPVAFGLFDPQERLRHANPAFLEAFAATLDGAPSWETLMRDCHRRQRGVRIVSDDIDAWITRTRRSYRQAPVRSFESDLTDGRWMWVTETLRRDGWVLVVMCDISPLKANEATLRHAHQKALIASLTDPLTELPNRRHIFARLEDLLRTSRDMRFALHVAVLDLDQFKGLNDAHGHAVGDAVLRHFAAELRRQMRPLDLSGRIGGEEFLLVLPNVALAGAEQALARLRQRLQSTAAVPELPALRYTFSAGLVTAAEGDTPNSLFQRADAAMYADKARARRRPLAPPDAQA